MAAHTQDDGFHEIQLNGKQLVFFFMAATVVMVVVFLCGVLVGRGVRTERGGSATESAAAVAPIEPTAQPPAPSTPTAGSDPTKAAPPPPADEVLTYNDRLQKSNPPAEVLKAPTKNDRVATPPPVEKAAAPTARAATPPPEKPAPQPVTKPAPPAPVKEPIPAATPSASASGLASAGSVSSGAGGSKGDAYVVQVAALNVRSEADAIAKRLTSKGYDAYVLDSAPGTPQVYRVRIGKFGSRREAQSMATRLQKEEQFKPWVTR